jgi:hypothetical protein
MPAPLRRRPWLACLVLALFPGFAAALPQAAATPGPPSQGVATLGGRAGGGPLVLDFEGFANGQALAGDELGSGIAAFASGANLGLAVFDTNPGGPNEHGQDPDLLVDRGNALILQENLAPALSAPGVYAQPNDDMHGGVVRFELATPARLLSVDLIDADPGGGTLVVTLTDAAARERVYTVPGGFTGDLAVDGPPGWGTLDLGTLAPQRGFLAVATAVEDPGFQPDATVVLELAYEGSMGIDDVAIAPSQSVQLPQPSHPVAEPYDLALADLDGDGLDELIVPDAGTNAVLVHANGGPDGFLPPESYATAFRPEAVEVADLDGDGDLDVAVGCVFTTGALTFNGALSVLLNQGDGTLGAQVEYELPDVIESLIAADLDGDGDVDVALGPRSQSSFDTFVLFNAGDGTFGAPDRVPSGSDPNHRRLMTADFDLDGLADLALPKSTSEEIRVWTNLGGAFGGYVAHDVGEDPESGVAKDLDLDGRPDVAVSVGDGVAVLLARGGGFAPAVIYPVAGAFGDTANAADVDGDGDRDLIVGTFATLSLLRNTGAGAFAAWLAYPTIALPYALDAGDVDADGDVDVLVGDASSAVGAAQVFRNRGDDTFHVREEFPTGERPVAVEVVDLDGDGVQDVLTADEDGDAVSVLLGTGGGQLAAPVAHAVADRPQAMTVGDLDGDGNADVAVACMNGDAVSILLGTGGGGFVAGQPFLGAAGAGALTAGDWNADGALDLTVAGQGSLAEVQVLLNDGGASFGVHATLDGSNVVSLGNGDWDLDGGIDLAITRYGFDGSLELYANAGDGAFSETHEYPVAGTPYALASGDWNGDGAADLAYTVTESGASAFEVRTNAGDGSFAAVDATFGLYNSPGSHAADVDGDGDLDVAVVHANNAQVSVYRNDGAGGFASRATFAAPASASAVRIADPNGDGLADLVVVGSAGDVVALLFAEED